MDEQAHFKPCPFCGGTNLEKYFGAEAEAQWVDCHNPDCGACGPDTTEAWNTRPLEDAKDARIAELEAQHEALGSEELWDAYSDVCGRNAELTVALSEERERIAKLEAENMELCEAAIRSSPWSQFGAMCQQDRLEKERKRHDHEIR